jgi:uncharacterized protein (TIGR02147 family)
MTKPQVYEYTNYKKYLDAVWKHHPQRGRGEKSRIAEFLRCHLTYVSQVMNGQNDFSIEQAEALNRYLRHTPDEGDYFLTLVMFARASTQELKVYFQKKIQKMNDERLVLKNRLEFKQSLSGDDEAVYFSAWYYAAIHLLLAIPKFQNHQVLSDYLSIPLVKVSQVIGFLTSAGLVTQAKSGQYERGVSSVHLGNDSALISKHHVNWRLQLLQALEREQPDELHYSSAVTIARSDLPKVRSILVAAIEQVREVVKDSKDESLFCYCLDLFEVGTKA